MASSLIHATIGTLDRADGSATYSCNGFSVIGGVNGPVEVQRRDELPEEALVDVVVRPVAGVGGVRERHLESIIQDTLRHVILVDAHPRKLIQVTLQVLCTQAEDSTFGALPQSASNIQVLPALLQTSILALLATSIPLRMTLTATLIAVTADKELIPDPSAQQVEAATSLHVLSFSSHGNLLVVESEGSFPINIWDSVFQKAEQICRGFNAENGHEDIDMDAGEQKSLEDILRGTMHEKMIKDQSWKENLA